MDLDRSHYILTQKENPLAQSERILKFSEKAPQTGRVIFEAAIQAPRPTKKAREIQQVPYRSLDAPNILDDYYVNPVDCGATGELAVALGQSVFVTSAKSTGSVDELVNFALEGSNDFATSVNWDGAGSYLAIGTNNAEVQIWDREHGKKIRTMKGHAARVGALSWNGALLSSGCRDGSIFNHDVRVAKHHVGSLSAHTQEVCGLKWSPDGSQLASGGNDNIVNIWDAGKTTPKFSMTEHQAAVKVRKHRCPDLMNDSKPLGAGVVSLAVQPTCDGRRYGRQTHSLLEYFQRAMCQCCRYQIAGLLVGLVKGLQGIGVEPWILGESAHRLEVPNDGEGNRVDGPHCAGSSLGPDTRWRDGYLRRR